MPQVMQWPDAPDAQYAVTEACQAALLRGELVVLPTESVYVVLANADQPDAVARLLTRHGADTPPPAVVLRGAYETLDWLPSLGPVGRRFARRCWPGPVVLMVPQREGNNRLPEAVRQSLWPDGSIRLTVPFHAAVAELLAGLAAPVVLRELFADDGEPVTTPEAMHAAAREAVAVVVEDGPTYFRKPPTVVELTGDSWHVRRAGAIGDDEIALYKARLVLFVCTGNTCRSPLAEVLCKKLLADRLGCEVEDLPRHGFLVASAGLAAMHGAPAAVEAVEVAQDLGADLSGHSSRPVTPNLLDQADVIVGMTASHLHGVTAYGPDLTADVRLLGGALGDLADPVGGDRDVYQACAGAIWQHLQELVAELMQKSEVSTTMPPPIDL